MWYGSLSERAGKAWEVPWRFNWGVVAPPGRRQRVSLLAVRAYAVGQRSARPGPAFEWAKYLALHPDEALDVPALEEAAQAETLFASEPAEVAAAARQALLEGRALPPVPWLLDLSRQLDRAIRDIFYSEKSVEDALTEAQEGMNSAIARQQGEE